MSAEVTYDYAIVRVVPRVDRGEQINVGVILSVADSEFLDARIELDRRGALLDQRRASGFVRQCHGDLHLRNIVLLEGRPTLFDGVEFNDEIACIDILYDVAFLLMDLWRRRLPRHANAVWNRYLADTADLQRG